MAVPKAKAATFDIVLRGTAYRVRFELTRDLVYVLEGTECRRFPLGQSWACMTHAAGFADEMRRGGGKRHQWPEIALHKHLAEQIAAELLQGGARLAIEAGGELSDPNGMPAAGWCQPSVEQVVQQVLAGTREQIKTGATS